VATLLPLLFKLHDESILCKADEVFMVCVHVRQLDFNEKNQLFLCKLLTFSHSSVDNSLRFLTKQWKTSHLNSKQSTFYTFLIQEVKNKLVKAQHKVQSVPAEVFLSCLAIVSAVMVSGLFLWPALQYGTGYQTV